jgi:DNA-binding response OmpR family regulator
VKNGEEALMLTREHKPIWCCWIDALARASKSAVSFAAGDALDAVIMLTAKSEEPTNCGLDVSADDYVTKPFRPAS